MSAKGEEFLPQQPRPDPKTGNESDRELSEEDLAQASGGLTPIQIPRLAAALPEPPEPVSRVAENLTGPIPLPRLDLPGPLPRK